METKLKDFAPSQFHEDYLCEISNFMNLDFLPHCHEKELCKAPLCHCYDAEKYFGKGIDLTKTQVGDILTNINNGLEILRNLLKQNMYYSRDQRRVYNLRKKRYLKNQKFWKKVYDNKK